MMSEEDCGMNDPVDKDRSGAASRDARRIWSDPLYAVTVVMITLYPSYFQTHSVLETNAMHLPWRYGQWDDAGSRLSNWRGFNFGEAPADSRRPGSLQVAFCLGAPSSLHRKDALPNRSTFGANIRRVVLGAKMAISTVALRKSTGIRVPVNSDTVSVRSATTIWRPAAIVLSKAAIFFPASSTKLPYRFQVWLEEGRALGNRELCGPSWTPHSPGKWALRGARAVLREVASLQANILRVFRDGWDMVRAESASIIPGLEDPTSRPSRDDSTRESRR
ncbi:hypothetical protein DFP72DRAFT_1115360 [Ephemerocybe angulata]|uniref:Uncharacterized protein n=1 Tax=Ephemerocybe angulata TaxID=980116 RepID=A0A8H6I379_9AGAR|nr:hypothetical protein DFP72DRAFT_1115360 [Tulosesus angulatus]